MSARRFTVSVRDNSTYQTLAAGDAYNRLEAHPRFNDIGSWSLTYPMGSPAAKMLAAGRGVAIYRRGGSTSEPVISGPVMSISETLDTTRKVPLLTFGGPCDNFVLAARLAYPVPGSALSSQTAAQDIRSGAGESVIKAYVNANVGPGALVARRWAGLTLDADLARGSSVIAAARMDTLLGFLRPLAVSAGLGFKVQQSGAGLVFTIYVPTDRSGHVRFSTKTKSLGSYGFQLTGPTATVAIVGDGGSGVGRAFGEYINTLAETDWGMRVEAFVDQSNTTSNTAVNQSGQQGLDSGSPQAQVTYTPRDTPQRAFGIDYNLGDSVSVEVNTATVVDIVREVAIIDDPTSGTSTSPTVGGSQSSDASSTPLIYKALRSVATAVQFIQRSR